MLRSRNHAVALILGLASVGAIGAAWGQTATQPGAGENQPQGTSHKPAAKAGAVAAKPKHPPLLWGDPYDRSAGSLAMTRTPHPPVKPEPVLPQSWHDWLAQDMMTGRTTRSVSAAS